MQLNRKWLEPYLGARDTDELSVINLADAAAFRSIVGHFVAGTEEVEELRGAIGKALAVLADEA